MVYFAHDTHESTTQAHPRKMTGQHRMQRMQKLADWLDRRWDIPGTGWKIGLDGMLGFIPGIGDTIGAALSSWIIYESHQLGVPWWLKMRMAGNMFVDWLVGTIPFVGDVFDIGWKANERNMRLLMAYMNKQGRQY